MTCNAAATVVSGSLSTSASSSSVNTPVAVGTTCAVLVVLGCVGRWWFCSRTPTSDLIRRLCCNTSDDHHKPRLSVSALYYHNHRPPVRRHVVQEQHRGRPSCRMTRSDRRSRKTLNAEYDGNLSLSSSKARPSMVRRDLGPSRIGVNAVTGARRSRPGRPTFTSTMAAWPHNHWSNTHGPGIHAQNHRGTYSSFATPPLAIEEFYEESVRGLGPPLAIQDVYEDSMRGLGPDISQHRHVTRPEGFRQTNPLALTVFSGGARRSQDPLDSEMEMAARCMDRRLPRPTDALEADEYSIVPVTAHHHQWQNQELDVGEGEEWPDQLSAHDRRPTDIWQAVQEEEEEAEEEGQRFSEMRHNDAVVYARSSMAPTSTAGRRSSIAHWKMQRMQATSRAGRHSLYSSDFAQQSAGHRASEWRY